MQVAGDTGPPFSAARRATSDRASARARLPRITWKNPNIARAVMGMLMAVPLFMAVLMPSCQEGTATGRSRAISVRATTTGAERPPRRATVTATINTHITKASARANGSSATQNATNAA